MGEQFLWVSGGGWGWVEVRFGWMGVGEQFLLVSGSRWGWVEVYFWWVWVGGGEWERVGVSEDVWGWSLVLV